MSLDIFKDLLKKQKELDDYIIEKRNLVFTPKERLQGLATAIMTECAELCEEVNWKWWKNEKEVDIDKIKEELIDILHFLMSAVNTLISNKEDISLETWLNESTFYTVMQSDTIAEDVSKYLNETSSFSQKITLGCKLITLNMTTNSYVDLMLITENEHAEDLGTEFDREEHFFTIVKAGVMEGLITWFCLCKILDMDWEEIKDIYDAKNKENFNRQDGLSVKKGYALTHNIQE